MTEAVLSDYQFELDGVVFGKGAPISVDGEEGAFDRSGGDILTQDALLVASEANAHGLDYTSPETWTWQMHTDQAEDEPAALADLALLERAWKNPAIRLQPQAVSKLRYAIAGRTRHVYGRPRRWASALDNRLLSGMSGVLAEFQRSDLLYFDDVERSTEVTAIPADPGGFYTPLITPITTLAGSPRLGTITPTGGDVPSPMRITFYGPEAGSASGVRVYGNNWSLGLSGTLQVGDVVEISTYPWGRRAIRNGTDNVAGLLETSGPLSSIRIPVEGDTLWFDSVDLTGTARCVVSWYPTYDTF